MSMVVTQQRIASAFFVSHGRYGDVSRYAQQRGVCRQRVYREAVSVQQVLDQAQAECQQLRDQVRQLQQQQQHWQQQLATAVCIDADKQAEVATVGQARGVSLRDCRALLEVLIPGRVLSVPTLGRRTQAAGTKAGPLLAVLDELAQQRVRDVAADEIYVKAPVLMAVEPESLCWVSGQLSAEVSGAAWQQQFAALPQLEQVTRDGGTALASGVAQLNARRQAAGQEPVSDQGDHYHALRGGGVGLRQAEAKARQALAAAEAADKAVAVADRHGQKRTGPAVRAAFAWKKAEQAMDEWQAQEKAWQQTKEALQLFTPAGQLNTRARAEAVLAQTLPQLPDAAFAKSKRQLGQPELLNYLDRVQRKIAALPLPEEVKEAALLQEGRRRRPEGLRGSSSQAAAGRGLLLVCALVLSQAGEVGQQAVSAIGEICRRACRASSLVECINSVLRMQQASHRRMTQGLIDLKRLYWNCHRFESGRRRKTTPYQRLGVPWPEDLRWWDVLKLTPEQLRDKLSTAAMAA
jgi:hypothetical protein